MDEVVDPNNLLAFKAVLTLLDKPYWSRLWILQEIAINKRLRLRFETDMRYELAMTDMMNFIGICNSVNVSRRITTFDESLLWQFSRVSDRVYPIAKAALLFPLTVDELQPLLYTHVWGGPIATDPLDCVYGLFGLFARAPLPVNYALSPRQLYVRVIQLEQERTGQLDFLSQAWANYHERRRSGFENKFKLPRWSVDFSFRTSALVPCPLAIQSHDQRIMARTIYRTSGDQKQNVEFASCCGDDFKASGVVSSTIEHIGSVHDASNSDLMWPQDWNAFSGSKASSAPLRSQQARASQPDIQAWSAAETSTCFEELKIW